MPTSSNTPLQQEPTCDDVIRAMEEQVREIVADDQRHHRSYDRQLADIRAWAGEKGIRYEPADEGLYGTDAVRNELSHLHLALVSQKEAICSSY